MSWLVRLIALVVIVACIRGSCFAAMDPNPPSSREPIVVLSGPDSTKCLLFSDKGFL
jgi:hypothetical protein